MNEQTKIISEHLFKIQSKKCFNLLIKKLKNKKIILYGASNMLAKLNEYYDLSKLNIIAVCDVKFNNKSNEDSNEIYGYKICGLDEVEKLNPDYVLVTLYNPLPMVKYLKRKFSKLKIMPFLKNSLIENFKLLFNKTDLYINYYIPIFLAADNYYAPFVATTAYSILKNTNSQIQFYIIDAGISQENKELIKKSLKRFNNYTIEYLPFPDLPPESSLLKHPRYNKVAFARFFIPKLKPELIKVLYLDVDIIVRSDITNLFMQSLDNYPIAAVPEDFQPYPFPGIGMLKKDCPEYNLLSSYFNDGVLIIDVQEFIRNNYLDRLMEVTESYLDIAPFADQCILNIFFKDNYKKLDYSMNYMPMLAKFYEKHLGKNFRKLKKNIQIYHYTSQYCIEAPFYCSDFWKIAKQIPFYDELKSRAFNSFLDKLKSLV